MFYKTLWTLLVELNLTDTKLFAWVEDRYYRSLVVSRKLKEGCR